MDACDFFLEAQGELMGRVGLRPGHLAPANNLLLQMPHPRSSVLPETMTLRPLGALIPPEAVSPSSSEVSRFSAQNAKVTLHSCWFLYFPNTKRAQSAIATESLRNVIAF